MGNTYAKLQKIDEAIDSYKAALKLKQDEDAAFNLAMLKQQKAKRKKNRKTKKDTKIGMLSSKNKLPKIFFIIVIVFIVLLIEWNK
jgi:Ca-activated chloride channel family protein